MSLFKKLFHDGQLNKKIIFLVVVFIMLSSIADILLIKLYDLSSKKDVTLDLKKISFCAIVFTSLVLQLILLQYTRKVIKTESKHFKNFRLYNRIAVSSFFLTMLLMTFLVFQVFCFEYYSSLILILIVVTTYGTASFFIGKTSTLFISWYRLKHDFVILLYFISMALIVSNLILTVVVVNLYLVDRPEKIRPFIGGSMDLSGGKYTSLLLPLKITSVLSFLSIWLTTVVLSYSSRDQLVKKLRYLIMPCLLLFYFLISYFSQDIFTAALAPLLQSDPVLYISLLLIIFSLIKPVGGIMFGIAFWNISKTVNYEKTLEKYLIITGYGFLFLFSANQSTSLALAPYPPFGISVITILITGSYLVMIGIYTSATLLSVNVGLRRSVHKIAKESKLLVHIGTAEMEKEVNNTVNKIVKEIGTSDEFSQTNIELDKPGLKEYLGEVIEELAKSKTN